VPAPTSHYEELWVEMLRAHYPVRGHERDPHHMTDQELTDRRVRIKESTGDAG
jgi:hypothetical protein